MPCMKACFQCMAEQTVIEKAMLSRWPQADRAGDEIPPSPLTESFETIDEPEAKSESETRSFCEISESERKRCLSLANRTSFFGFRCGNNLFKGVSAFFGFRAWQRPLSNRCSVWNPADNEALC